MASVHPVKRTWYSLDLPRALYLTVWVSLSITLIVSLGDFSRWFIGFGIPSGKFQPMMMISTICFMMAAVVILLQRIIPGFSGKIITYLFTVIIWFVSILSIYVHSFQIITGKESVVSEISQFNFFLSHGSRMALFTACIFLIVGIILLLLQHKKSALAHIFTIPVALMGYFFLISYILNVNTPASEFFPLSLNTSIAFTGLCSAIFMMNPDTWLIRVFTSGTTGGIIARQLLLPLIVIPIIIGWLRITGEKMGLFSSEVGVVLVALVYTVCFVLLAWHAARSVNKIDKKRLESEEITAKSHARMELLSEIASRLLVTDNPQKIVNELCNEIKDFLNCEVFLNYLVDELSGRLRLNAFGGISETKAEEIRWIDFGTAVYGCLNDGPAEFVRSLGIRAYSCHPLLSHEKVIGTLSFGDINRDHFSSDDLSLMKIMADQVAIAMGRIRNEKALRDSEDRFRTIAESLPVQISISRISDSTVRFTNDAYNAAFGFKKGELIGKKARDLYYNPEERSKLIETLREKGFVDNFETRVVRSDGTPFWILASVRIITFEGEPSYLSALMDINQLKNAQRELLQLNRTLNALGKSSQVMMHTTNELQYLTEVCRIITEDCSYLMVWIGYARDDSFKTVEPMAYFGIDRGYIEKMNISWDDTERGRGPTGTTIRTGKPTICRNMQTDPNFEPWRVDAIKRGYASSIVLPLISDEKVFGALNIYSRERDAFSTEDIDLLTNLANDLSYGITNIRLTESERNAARAIKESEEKYRLLFDEMVEGFALHEIILDEHGHPYDYRFISVNPAFEKQTGLKAEQVLGKTAREVLPGFEKIWIENYGNVALTGQSMDFENYSADLQSYFRVSAFSPKKGYFAVIFENITKRILAERELQNTKNYLENLINYANAPIIVWNSFTEIQLFNHAFEHLTGYTSAEVLGKKLDLLFPDASLLDSNEKIKIALTKNWETIEIPILTKDKQVKTVLWNSANIYDSDNKTILSTIAQGHDITERIQAERDVRTSKDKLDLALENANIGIWTWDIRNDRFEWDEKISRMFGLNSPVEQGRYDDFEKYIFEEDIPHFNRAIKKALQDDVALDTIFRAISDPDGFKYIDAKGRVEKDIQGKPVKMTGVCLDITAMQKTTEKTLFSLNEDLLRSNRELEQFAYVASHDLQEPLRMVSSFTQLLAARYHDKLDKEAQEFIDFAVDGAQRMQRLINDLLQYSRIKTRGKILSVIDMNEVLRQTKHNLSLKIIEKKAVIINGTLPAVFADEGQMIQLFQNLLENGIKFCKKVPRIHISSFEEEDYFLFSVKDNGIGIEPQYYERIFQIFQRLHLRDEYGGTGIGLAICERIVERHGGRIWVESKYGHGTTVMFTIRKA